MNSAATSQADPFVSLAGVPVELVSFLHRAGIVVADRRDDQRVRLVDFAARLGE